MTQEAAPTVGPARMPAPAVFLGALASEVNEPDVLDPAFAAIADMTERIVTAVRAGALAEVPAAEHLQVLRLQDSSGVQWAVGATSLRWYRKVPGGVWKLAVPPQSADDAARVSSQAALGAMPTELVAGLAVAPLAAADPEWGYAADPFVSAEATPVAPWEYEMGDDRRLTGYSGSGDPS